MCFQKSSVLHVFSIKKNNVLGSRRPWDTTCIWKEKWLQQWLWNSFVDDFWTLSLMLSVHSKLPSFLCQFYTQCLFLLVFSCQLISLLFNRAASVFAAHLFSICGENLGVLTFDAGVRQDISLIAAWSDRCGALHQKAWQFISSCLADISKKDKISLDNLPEPFLHNPG